MEDKPWYDAYIILEKISFLLEKISENCHLTGFILPEDLFWLPKAISTPDKEV